MMEALCVTSLSCSFVLLAHFSNCFVITTPGTPQHTIAHALELDISQCTGHSQAAVHTWDAPSALDLHVQTCACCGASKCGLTQKPVDGKA
jgi:hypothetical protein